MSHDTHNHESPKRVYFGIPIAFAMAFWLVVFLTLKACDGGHKDECCGEECSKECMEHCKAEGKDCVKHCEAAQEEEKRDVPKAAEGGPESKEEVKGKEGEETKTPAESEEKGESKDAGHH